MRIALLGYGKMGKMIERIAIERGHEIVLIVDENNRAACTDEQLKQADVAIEFTMPAVAVENYKWCFDNGVPVVSGTTGWLERWDEVVACCREQQGGFFYASNFSIGVNIFFQLNKYLAVILQSTVASQPQFLLIRRFLDRCPDQFIAFRIKIDITNCMPAKHIRNDPVSGRFPEFFVLASCKQIFLLISLEYFLCLFHILPFLH